MTFKDFAIFLEKLEKTASRNTMIEILAELFRRVPTSEIDKSMYLLQGRVAPLFIPLEFGMADKMMTKAIAKAYAADNKVVAQLLKKTGDLGKLAEKLSSKFNPSTKLRTRVQSSKLGINEVFESLVKVTRTGGEGSVDLKIETISNLLKHLDSLSVRFVARIPVGKLRLGFSDMTILDSLSWMLSKSKVQRPAIEKAFNVRPDLGFIAKQIKERGIKGVEKLKPEVFTPILMARAERLSSASEIIEKIGECAVEPKIDGFRLQVHYKETNNEVRLFTRNLEDATFMYPDIVEGVKKQIKVRSAIFEGEAIAYNPDTGEFLPFQETVQRKRKYRIEEMAKVIPLKLICFDLLYARGKNFIDHPYIERRKELERIVSRGGTLILSDEKVLDNAHDVEIEFDKAVSLGLEGIMAKKLDGAYQAGARGWNWIKYKRSYAGKLQDTIDCIVMGYYYGRGKRTAFGIGAFLIGIYDKKRDLFVTMSKVGTGLTDKEWRELHNKCEKIKIAQKPALYDIDKLLAPDVWVKPQIVVEIRADEITRSPVHTAGRKLKPSKSGEAFEVDIPGFALRFPRLERFRDDKKPEDATTLKEVEEMFAGQKHVRYPRTS